MTTVEISQGEHQLSPEMFGSLQEYLNAVNLAQFMGRMISEYA